MNRGTFVMLAGAALAAPRPAGAESLTFADAVARLFTAHALDAAWFAPNAGFPPPATLQSVLAGFVATLGAYTSIAPNGAAYTLTFAHGTMQVQGTIADGTFTSLLFSRMQCKAAADRLAALFTTDPIPAAWFNDHFLAVISIDKLRAAIAGIKAQNGAFTGVAPVKDGSYDVAFAHGHVIAVIDINADGVVQDIDLLPPPSA
jgi:hypothetical protein